MGKATKKQKEIHRTVYEAQGKALEQSREGMRCDALDAVARNHIKKMGYGNYFGHGLGHGLGIEIHEAPTVSFKSKTMLKEGIYQNI